MALLEEEADINQLTEFFSYEHFYVIYCKFWELDTDHDLLIDAQDLARHNDRGERRPAGGGGQGAGRTRPLSGWRPAASQPAVAAPPPVPGTACGTGRTADTVHGHTGPCSRTHGTQIGDTGPAAGRRGASARLLSGPRSPGRAPLTWPGTHPGLLGPCLGIGDCPTCQIHATCAR